MRKVRTSKQFGRVGRPKSSEFNVSKFEIAKLELHDGDMIVLRTDLFLTREQVAHVRERATEQMPKGVKVVILTSGFSLAVLQDKRTEQAIAQST